MSYKHPAGRLVKLEQFDGFEARIRTPSLKKILAIMRSADQVAESGDLSPDQTAEVTGQLIELFGECLQGWNLIGDDDQAVPPTGEALAEQPFDFTLVLITSWLEGVTAVTPNLQRASSPGPSQADLEASLPMETSPSGPGS